MPREFYTEKDIEDLFRGGVMSLHIHDDVMLTELAYEKARALGLKLMCNGPEQPPSAPVRPYISQKPGQAPRLSTVPPMMPPLPARRSAPAEKNTPAAPDLPQRIRDAVLARVGAQVDAKLLDVIIKRVLASTGAK